MSTHCWFVRVVVQKIDVSRRFAGAIVSLFRLLLRQGHNNGLFDKKSSLVLIKSREEVFMSNEQRSVISRRNFGGVRLSLAQEFCQHSGSAKAFRALFDPAKDESFHRLYTALDIRKARLRMAGENVDVARSRTTPPLINFRMAKGGTGKSTLCSNVATCLSLMGYKVLLIDADPQASLTSVFGINWATEEITHIGELMHRVYQGRPACVEKSVWSIYPGGMLDIIPSDITLANADSSWLMSATNREASFKRLLDAELDFFSQYDVIMVDSAPGASLLTNAIMFATKTILAVVMLNGHSIRAMEVLASSVSELNHHFADRGLNIGVHIVANGYMAGYASCIDALTVLKSQFGAYLNDNIIPHAATFMRDMNVYAESSSGTALEREPRSFGARAIIGLTNSLIEKYGIQFPDSGERVVPTPKKRKAGAA